MRLLTLFLLASLTAAAQEKPVALNDQEAHLWEHATGPREAIHVDLTKVGLSSTSLFMAHITLEVVVSANGRVDSAHAVEGPKALYEQAERIELTRLFKPFLQNNVPARVMIHDYVSLNPPEVWRDPRVPFPAAVDMASTTIGLSRTGCYGTCPAYQLTISGDGTVRYTGELFVLIPGQHTSHIAPQTVKDLVEAFRRADFLSARSSYRAPVTDCPTQTISLTIGGVTHTVEDYMGSEVGLPDVIQDLERQIDETAGSERWVKGNAETAPSLTAEHWPFKSSSNENIVLYNSAIQRSDAALVDMMIAARAPVAAAPGKASFDQPQMPPLCVASGRGDSDLVARMIETTRVQGKLPPLPQSVLDTCLAAAAHSGSLPLVDRWLDSGANPVSSPSGQQSRPSLSIIASAVDSGNPAVVSRLLRYPVNLKEQIYDRIPILAFAADHPGRVAQSQEDHSAEIVKLLVAAGVEPNTRDEGGRTALFCNFCKSQEIAALVAVGATVDARDSGGRTPLIATAYNLEHVEALLAAGADPAAHANDGLTALSQAKRMNCAECIAAIDAALRKREDK